MKARIKATGEVVDIIQYGNKYQVFGRTEFYSAEELLFLPGNYPQEIDWEQRMWDATVAIMAGMKQEDADVHWAVMSARNLVEEYRKK